MKSWDIFCQVIDNYGDIGVTWRLARQIATELHQPVRLFVDDLHTFHHICPQIDPLQDCQRLLGVDIVHWRPDSIVDPSDIVIEAFGCNLSESIISSMLARAQPPIWINLEYLSAEPWIEECHLLPSPQCHGPAKYFFFPGFTARTGGLLRERDLLAERDRFIIEEKAEFLTNLGVEPAPGSSLISLFTYENPQISSWLDTLVAGEASIQLLVPPGRIQADIEHWLGEDKLVLGACYSRGSVVIHPIPFLSQRDYDRLLWSCDLNFVRGEDSFVRAQWAGKPFLWHIYAQDDEAHLQKLSAFLQLYRQQLDAPSAKAMTQFWIDWNRRQDLSEGWTLFTRQRDSLESHAHVWCSKLSMQKSLVESLAEFIQN